MRTHETVIGFETDFRFGPADYNPAALPTIPTPPHYIKRSNVFAVRSDNPNYAASPVAISGADYTFRVYKKVGGVLVDCPAHEDLHTVSFIWTSGFYQ